MNLGFSSIIADGLRNGQQEQSNAFARLGQGLGAASQGITQHQYSKGNKDLFTQKMELEQKLKKDGQLSPEDQQRLDGMENMIRNHNMNYYNRGARVALTPQDYERRDAAEMAAKQAQEAAKLKALQDAEERETKVLDSFKDTDWRQFDSIKEYEANNSLLPETRNQLINAMARENNIRSDEAKQLLLGELSEESANGLRGKVEQIAKSAGTEFNQALKKVTGGSFSDLPKLLAAIPAVMAQGWAGKDTDTAIRIKNALDAAFDSSLDAALVERSMRGYSPEQIKVGMKKSRDRQYKPAIGCAEDFNE